MASNKNQHYVPQCYLRQFSSEASSAAINLFNIDRKRLIKCAPIKNQCSKNYFYGKDLRLEKALQPIEGEYSSAVKEISEPRYCLTDEHRTLLKHFWLLQNMRTEAASKRSIEMREEMGEVARIEPKEYRMELNQAVQESMELFVQQMGVVDDLKICLLKNKTNIDYITSDDPAVLTNRWHLSKKRVKGVSFGLGSAGIIILLPLTPRVMCVGYDGHVYSMAHKKGWIDVRDESDVKAYNEHQFLNCRANIFIKGENEQTELSTLFDSIEKHRPEARHRINCAILDKNENGFKSYRVVNRDEAGEHEEAVIHCQMVNATPNHWPKQIRWRNGGFVYNNDSGVGYIRQSKAKTMPNDGFRKEPA